MPSVTLGDLKGRLYEYLERNSLFYPDDELVDAINESICTLNLYTGFLQGNATTMFTVANRVIYDVPSNILMLMRVKLRDRYLEPVGLTAMCRSNTRWMKNTTATEAMPVANWVPIGVRRFALYPADAIGGSAMLLTGVLEPTPLVDDDDVMQFPNEYDTTVIDLSKHVLQLDEGGAIFTKASTGYQEFLRDAKELTMFKNLKMPSYFVDQELRK